MTKFEEPALKFPEIKREASIQVRQQQHQDETKKYESLRRQSHDGFLSNSELVTAHPSSNVDADLNDRLMDNSMSASILPTHLLLQQQPPTS